MEEGSSTEAEVPMGSSRKTHVVAPKRSSRLVVHRRKISKDNFSQV